MKEEYPLSFSEINQNPETRLCEFRNDPSPIVFLLDEMEDPRNLGSIFRIADAARVSTIYGYRMNNIDSSKIEKVSRQTNEHISFNFINSLAEVEKLSKAYIPIALEYTNKSKAFNMYVKNEPCMLIIGNERRGVSKELLSICHSSLHIPMLGQNSSMNVSVATGIVVYHLLKTLNKI